MIEPRKKKGKRAHKTHSGIDDSIDNILLFEHIGSEAHPIALHIVLELGKRECPQVALSSRSDCAHIRNGIT